jgi:YaiO family outer membrane protein
MLTTLAPVIASPAASSPITPYASALESIKRSDFGQAESQLRRALDLDPRNAEAKFQLARVLSWQKKYQEGAVLYRELLQSEPANTDYMLGLGQTMLWSGQRDEAVRVMAVANRLDNHNPDLRRLQIQALEGGNDEQKKRAAELRERARKDFPNADWAQAPAAAPRSEAAPAAPGNEVDPMRPLPNQIEVGGTYDGLNNARGSWNSQYLDFSKQFARRTSVYGGVQRSERFNLEDAQLNLGGYLPIADRWTVNLEGTYSPTGRVLAQHSETFRLLHNFDFGLVLGAGYRFREYRTATTHAALFSAEQYLGPFRLAYNYSPSFVSSQDAHTHSVQLGYWYTDYSFVNLSYSVGNEINNIETGSPLCGGICVVSSQVAYYGINGRHWITPEWAITWAFSHQSQGPYYDRTGGQIGVRWAF